jgi:hypothetical protein
VPRAPASRARWGAVVLGLAWLGCGTTGAGARAPAPVAHAAACGRDETREYFCEDLLPTAAAVPAPAPYQACPGSIESPAGEAEQGPAFAPFDTGYTEYTRRRAPPGHSCCYSWCSKVTLANPSAASGQAACQKATAFREEYCMEEPEGGTALSVGAPFERCPAAIVPPRKAVFAVPEAALFDAQLSGARRAKGQTPCCYGWCSDAPPGSGLQQQRH